jgi:hypothetical protein
VEDARAANSQVSDLARIDTLFFSNRPESHAELAAAIYWLNPTAFRSLTQMMSAITASPEVTDHRAQGVHLRLHLRHSPAKMAERRQGPRMPRGNSRTPLNPATLRTNMRFFTTRMPPPSKAFSTPFNYSSIACSLTARRRKPARD